MLTKQSKKKFISKKNIDLRITLEQKIKNLGSSWSESLISGAKAESQQKSRLISMEKRETTKVEIPTTLVMTDKYWPSDKIHSNLSAFLGEKMCTPSMFFSILESRPDSQIINPEKSFISLYQVLKFLRNFVSQSKKSTRKILFLNTYPEFNTLNSFSALQCNQPYVNNKWVGGTLTNWKQISNTIKRYLYERYSTRIKKRSFEKRHMTFQGFDPCEVNTYNQQSKLNKLRLVFENWRSSEKSYSTLKPSQTKLYITSARKSSRGLQSLSKELSKRLTLKVHLTPTVRNKNRIPSNMVQFLSHEGASTYKRPKLLIVLNPDANQIAIKEARLLKIPVIAFVSSETNREGITYPIIGNNKNLWFVFLCLNWMTKIMSTIKTKKMKRTTFTSKNEF